LVRPRPQVITNVRICANRCFGCCLWLERLASEAASLVAAVGSVMAGAWRGLEWLLDDPWPGPALRKLMCVPAPGIGRLVTGITGLAGDASLRVTAPTV
jgi:hypothetical protein